MRMTALLQHEDVDPGEPEGPRGCRPVGQGGTSAGLVALIVACCAAAACAVGDTSKYPLSLDTHAPHGDSLPNLLDSGPVDSALARGRMDSRAPDSQAPDSQAPDQKPGRVCDPGVDRKPCYTGPSGTRNKGRCKDGIQTCLQDGSGWSACKGQITPDPEVCNGIDDNCDGAADNGRACPVGCQGKRRAGRNFALCSDPLSWDDAQAACRLMSMDLAHIATQGDNDWVQAWANELLPGVDVWLGGSDNAKEGVWVWTDGTTPDYANWAANEPNDDSNEDCLELRPDGRWNDTECDKRKPFVCRQ